MALRIAVDPWNSGSKPADPPARTNVNVADDERQHMRKQTFDWIATSAQSRFRRAWSVARKRNIEHT